MKRSKVGLLAVGIMLSSAAAVLLWYFESPVWTLSRMKSAAEANDPNALDAYIDYPALREDFKAKIEARMLSEAEKDESGLSAVGAAIGSAVIGPMIDGIVSPAGMQAALIARHDQQRASNGGPASALAMPDRPIIKRRSFSEFLVATKGRPGSGLVFRRHGLSWKLSGVELPPQS